MRVCVFQLKPLFEFGNKSYDDLSAKFPDKASRLKPVDPIGTKRH